jgi:hypothetical protein
LIAEPCFSEVNHEYRKSAPETYWDFLCTGKFAWIVLNGGGYGWTRKGRNVGQYRIVKFEMGKVIIRVIMN